MEPQVFLTVVVNMYLLAIASIMQRVYLNAW